MIRCNYDSLQDILLQLNAVPKIIKRKQQAFEARLCDPTLDPFKAFNKLTQLNHEIDYLNWKVKTFKQIISKASEADRQILKLVMQGKNIFLICDQVKMTRNAVARKIKRWTDLLARDLKYDILTTGGNEK